MTNIDFNKMGGLVPAIIQDATTRKVLMLGFMNNHQHWEGNILEPFPPMLVDKRRGFWQLP